MGYSNFKKMRQVTERFGLTDKLGILFTKVKPVKPSAWLLKTIQIGYTQPVTNEKSRAERVISPVLLEVCQQYNDKISFFSGEELNVDAQADLAGPCDFFFALHAPKLDMEAPVISLAEAKNEDYEWGVAQCAAQMYAAYLFNQKNGKPCDVIYGCSTTGDGWQFLRFENNCFTIEPKPLTDLAAVIGTWHRILEVYLKNTPPQ